MRVLLKGVGNVAMIAVGAYCIRFNKIWIAGRFLFPA